MSVKINVKMTEEHMFHFMIYHNYSSFSGIFGVILGLGGLAIAVHSFVRGDLQYMAIGFIVAVMFLFVTPYTTKSRAKMQVRNSQMFQKPLEYEFTEEGVTVRQEGLEATNPWSDFTKAVSTKGLVILYITRVRALIFPKECIGDAYEQVEEMIRTHMPAARVKMK